MPGFWGGVVSLGALEFAGFGVDEVGIAGTFVACVL